MSRRVPARGPSLVTVGLVAAVLAVAPAVAADPSAPPSPAVAVSPGLAPSPAVSPAVSASPAVPASPAAATPVRVTVRARSDDRCPVGPDCSAGVTVTPIEGTVPVADTVLDPAADATDPAGTLVLDLPSGAYAITVTARQITEAALFENPDDPTPEIVGGCSARLDLAPGSPPVSVTAAMAWDQPMCGIVIDPRSPFIASRPAVLTAPIRATGPAPRFKPRGAPDATATENGVRLDLWIEDATLEQGQWLLARLRITNVSRSPIRYVDGRPDLACPPLETVVDTSALFDPGATWTGVAATFKDGFLNQSGLLRVPFVSPTCDKDTGAGDVGYGARLEPGEVVEMPLAAMPAYALRHQPLPGGTLHVSVGFRDSGRRRDTNRVTVGMDVTLAGSPVSYPTPGQLADAALGTPGFITVLEASDPDAWMQAGAQYWKKAPYPSARLAGVTAPRGILEIDQLVGSDIDRPFVVGAAIDPWTGESFGSSWF